MFNQTIKYIEKGKYEEASILFGQLNEKEKEDLSSYIYDNESFAFYGFYKYMYNKTKDISFLDRLEVMMSFDYCHFEGAETEGFRIQKEIVSLERSEVNLWALLIYFDMPTRTLTNDEAEIIAKEILKLNPDNERALETLEVVKRRNKNRKTLGIYENTFQISEEFIKEKESVILKEKAILKIVYGRYEELDGLLMLLSEKDKLDILFDVAKKLESFSSYSYSKYVYEKTGNIQWLKLGISISLETLSHIPGTNTLAFVDSKELLSLERNEENLSLLLSFYKYPEEFLEREEIEAIAKEILEINPNNEEALKVLKDLE